MKESLVSFRGTIGSRPNARDAMANQVIGESVHFSLNHEIKMLESLASKEEHVINVRIIIVLDVTTRWKHTGK